MSIYFVTGNQNKLAEVQAVMPQIEGWEVDLPEIQEIDPQAIIEAKLDAAGTEYTVMVEDTSLYVDAMNGLPGPLVKWFLKTVGTEGMYQMTECLGSYTATAKTTIGYQATDGTRLFVEADLRGSIVPARGANGFGWDVLFQPDGYERTIAEMEPEEKQEMSMRTEAVEHLQAKIATEDTHS